MDDSFCLSGAAPGRLAICLVGVGVALPPRWVRLFDTTILW